MLFLGHVPERLADSKVVFIPKPGKADYSVPKAYRPVSLTSTIFKVMERVVLAHLESTTLKDYPLHKKQHAFRKGSSCDSALSEVMNNIERAIMQGEYAIGVFLDITGAFSNISLEAASQGMRRGDLTP